MKFIFGNLLPVLILSFLTNCSRGYYAPNMANVPMFKNEGELHVTGAISSGINSKSIEGQAAYSITPRTGIMANFISTESKNIPPGKLNSYSRLAEAGVGNIYEIDDVVIIENYVGFGLGTIHKFRDGVSSSKISYSRLFYQPSIGYSGKYFDIGLATRLAMMHQYNINFDPVSPPIVDDLSPRLFLLTEPALVVRGGLKNVKLQAQLIGSFAAPYFSPGILNIGVGVAVVIDNPLKKKVD